jgi:hypothetical protein
MSVVEVTPALWRWTAPHPRWRQARHPLSPLAWPRDVGCVLADFGSYVIAIDPLLDEDTWKWFNEVVADRPVSVIRTCPAHTRSCKEVSSRYARAEPTDADVVHLRGFRERVVWLPVHRALVPGDTLLAFGEDASLRLCPDTWLRALPGSPTRQALADALRPLVRLGPRLILVSHGEPIVTAATASLRKAIREALDDDSAT